MRKSIFATVLFCGIFATTLSANIIQEAVPLTKAQAKKKVEILTKRIVNIELQNIKKACAELWMLYWNNPDGLTPQEAFDALGTDGPQICLISSAAAQFMNAIKLGTVSDTTPKPLSVVDGKIVVGE